MPSTFGKSNPWVLMLRLPFAGTARRATVSHRPPLAASHRPDVDAAGRSLHLSGLGNVDGEQALVVLGVHFLVLHLERQTY
jgi:hypothetical protein